MSEERATYVAAEIHLTMDDEVRAALDVAAHRLAEMQAQIDRLRTENANLRTALRGVQAWWRESHRIESDLGVAITMISDMIAAALEGERPT